MVCTLGAACLHARTTCNTVIVAARLNAVAPKYRQFSCAFLASTLPGSVGTSLKRMTRSKESMMEIGGSTPGSTGIGVASLRNTSAGTMASALPLDDGDDGDDGTTTSGTQESASLTQDDAVDISAAGYAAASSESDGDGDGDDGGDDLGDVVVVIDDSSDQPIASDKSDESDSEANAQPVRSLVYGALGLERPDQASDPNEAYSIGRWVGAGLTIGGIVSLFV
jgi:hypothetical protein